MKEAINWENSKEHSIKCFNCLQGCLINPGQKGLCQVRQNIDGILFSLNYGKLISQNVDPIEKKPLFHFLPGSLSYSIASVGCNFRCLHCQNYSISQVSPLDEIPGEDVAPWQVVNSAKSLNCKSIAYTYTEPTIYVEYALEVMKQAKKEGLFNVWVSNGYFTKETFELIEPYLDAINIDLKFFTEDNYNKICGAKFKHVKDSLIRVSKSKVHLEVTTLLIPGLNDSDEEVSKMAKFIRFDLGSDTPWHLTAFCPEYKLDSLPPTPESSIENAIRIAKDNDLSFVYAGNLKTSKYEDTYCTECGELLILRRGYIIEEKYRNNKVCPKCGIELPFVL
ncbi:MAG TPA: AmmeMemoRadiSam system radical SAM enzyme [Candidatus Bipolaricaulota bacterium]|nr:AmmeMemoRadiSam system radical SAM enzyme [Candidatus Bipolaricaulota bacterium]